MIPVEGIQEIWDSFIQAESSTSEKAAWLDVLLATILAEMQEGRHIQDILSFCLPGDICTLIGCELFADVHRICSFAGDGEDLLPLQNYLLRGRGWRSLVILDALDIKGLSCSEELANLLISLYPVCLRYKSSSSKKNPFIFVQGLRNPGNKSQSKSHSLKPKNRKQGNHGSIFHGGAADRSDTTGVMCSSLHGSAGQSPLQASITDCSATSESEVLEEEISHSKSNAIKFHLNPMDFDYFTSIVRSEDESHFEKFHPELRKFTSKLECKKGKLTSDFVNSSVKAVLESEVSVLEFCVLSMRLLQTLCEAVVDNQSDSNEKIAPKVLCFVLENLCSVQSGPEVSFLPLGGSVACLKVDMCWLLQSALVVALKGPVMVSTHMHNKILSTVLRLLEDVLKKTSARNTDSCSENKLLAADTILGESKDDQEYVFGLVSCIFLFLHSLLDSHKPNSAGLELFVDMFCILEKSLGGSLLELAVVHLSQRASALTAHILAEEGNAPSLAFQVVEEVGALVAKLKHVRLAVALKEGSLGNMLGQMSKRKPVKGRRQSQTLRASSSHLVHHHKTDVFGVSGLVPRMVKDQPSTPCIPSSLFAKLVRLMGQEELGVALKTHVVRVAVKCGSCCCFPSTQLLDVTAAALVGGEFSEDTGSRKYRNACFSLLERVLYPQLWGCVLPLHMSPVLPTHLCCLNFTDAASSSLLSLGNMNWKALRHMPSEKSAPICMNLGPAFNSLQSGQCFGSDDNQSQWLQLNFYCQLTESEDFKLCHSALAHLLRVVAVASPKVLCELLALVIFPTFVSAKSKYLTTKCEIAKFRLLSCLSIFSCYLGKCPEFSLAFFDVGLGLEHVIDLIFLPEFSQACCSILEEIILIGIQKVQESPTVSGVSVKDIRSNVILLKTVEIFSRKIVLSLIKDYNGGVTCSSLGMAIRRLAEEYSVVVCGTDSDYAEPVEPQGGLNGAAHSQSTVTKEILAKLEVGGENCDEVLKFAAMFWNACANLVLQSELYREVFSSSPVCEKGFLLLQMLVLHIVGGHSAAGAKFSSNLCLKLIEAVLIVSLKCLHVEQETGKPFGGKAGVLEKLRSLVFSLQTKPDIKLCHLCEVLIRCATDDCKGRPALLLARKPELPCLKLPLEDGENGEALDSMVDEEDDGGSGEGQRGTTRAGEVAYVTADEGYDGDVEVPEVDEGGRPGCHQGSEESPMHALLVNSPWAAELASSTLGLYGRKWSMRNVVYPELCCLSVDLLVHIYNSYLDAAKGAGTEEEEGGFGSSNAEAEDSKDKSKHTAKEPDLYVEGITQCLQRLAALCRENPSNCIILSKEGIITRLLEGFTPCLQHFEAIGLQQVLLDIFTYLAHYSITPKELALYLGFFKSDNPPLDALIIPLSNLVVSSRPQPHFIMCFPVEASACDLELNHSSKESLSSSQKKVKSNNILYMKHATANLNSEENAAITLARNLHEEHVHSGISSVWALSDIVLPIDVDIGWSPWTHGFSLSMWLQLGSAEGARVQGPPSDSCPSPLLHTPSTGSSQHLSVGSLNGAHSADWTIIQDASMDDTRHLSSTPPPADGCITWKPVNSLNALHLFSVGSETLALEVWINPGLGMLTFKLTKGDGQKFDILCEYTVGNCLPIGQWHHLAVNVKDYMQGRKTVVEVTLFINGCRDQKVLLPFSGLVMRRVVPTCLLLGHCIRPGTKCTSSWYFGNLMLFRGPVFSKERALHLMSMGPNFTHLTDCDVEKQHPNFTSLLSSNSMHMKVNWDALFEGSSGSLKVLQDSLLLTYSADNPKFVNVYPLVVTSPGGVVGSLFPGQPGFRVVTVDQRASQQLPIGLHPSHLSSHTSNLQQHCGLVAATSSLGGAATLLFLFARTVEMRSSEECQARALGLLLKLVHDDGDLYSQFINEDYHKLIIRVLTCSACKPGNYILKVLLDVSCDKSVLHLQSASRKFQIVSQSNAIITQPLLLLIIMQGWRAWQEGCKSVPAKVTNRFEASYEHHAGRRGAEGSVHTPPGGDDEGSNGLALFFAILLTLLRDDHSYREFNAAQLNRVGMVDAILMFCKGIESLNALRTMAELACETSAAKYLTWWRTRENFTYSIRRESTKSYIPKECFLLDDSLCTLSPAVCCSLVEVIRSLMGAPPEFSHIVALTDFLILVHRASATYISHARSSFYFLLSRKPPLGTASSPPAASRSRLPSSSIIAHPMVPAPSLGLYRLDHRLKGEVPPGDTGMKETRVEKESLLAQPVDPQKLNKALTNLQIKQTGEGSDGCLKKINLQPLHKMGVSDSALIVDSNKVATDESIGIGAGDLDVIGDKYGEGSVGVDEEERGYIDSLGICEAGMEKMTTLTKEHAVSSMETLVSRENNRIYADAVFGNLKFKDNSAHQSFSSKHMDEKRVRPPEGLGMLAEGSPSRKDDIKEEGTGRLELAGDDKCHAQPLVIEGLLLLLRDTLLVLPDSMSHQVLNYVVRAEALLVMANHSDSRVRTAVVKVISAYLQRAGDEEANRFLKARGFHLLANQLGQFDATPDLVEACVSLVTRCNASLEEQAEVSSLMPSLSPLGGSSTGDSGVLGSLQAAAFPPLLALLPKTIHDASLAHNLMLFLQETFTKVLHGSRPLLDSGLLEALAKTLVAVAHLHSLCGSSKEKVADPSDLEPLVTDMHHFLVAIVSFSVSSSGAHHLQVINDIQHLLNFLESTEKTSCGVDALCVQIVREAHLAVLNGGIETIQTRMASPNTCPGSLRMRSTSSILSSVLSSCDDSNTYDGRGPSPSSSSFTSGAYSTYVNSDVSTGYSKQMGTSKDLPKSEVNERFKLLLQKSVDFLVNAEPRNGRYDVSKCEVDFSRFIFSLIIQGLSTVLEKNPQGKSRSGGGSATLHGSHQTSQKRPSMGGEGSLWNLFAWTARDFLRIQAGRLLLFMLSPWQTSRQRTFVLYMLIEESNCREILTMVLQTHPQVEHRFAVFCQDALHSRTLVGEGKLLEQIRESLEALGVVPPLTSQVVQGEEAPQQLVMGPEHPLWAEEVSLLQEELVKQRLLWQKQHESAQLRSVHKFETLVKNVTESALDVTRTVVDIQNVERKSFMEHVKLAYSTEVQVKAKWQRVVQQLTHERAVWFFPKSYPRSWQQDSTEGPGRVRIRLQRCHLGLGRKFLMKDFQDKLDAFKWPTPLSYLFVPEKKSRPHTSSVLIECILTDEKIRHNCAVCIVTPALEVHGEILIGESSLYFVADKSISEKDMWEVVSGGCGLDGSSMAWPLDDVLGVYNRRFQLQERALEIFLVNGKTYLIAFGSSQERDSFVAELSRCQLPNQLPSDNLNDIIQMWREGLITNFEYLTQLNKMAGRSFNDLMQYPVFPFIIADYTGQTVDLMDPKVYRNLRKPMAVQEKKNELHYVRYYNYWKEQVQDVFNSISLHQEPHHYSSHYSNSGTVLHFLVRLPPFTQMFISYQDRNFDIPDRTFHSLQTTWRLTSTDSTTDVKELIPEFFFLPEFLLNSEGFNFGVRQNEERVNDVHLPAWCEGDARKFILVHRQALESDHVRENIHHWVDLVFGYKQTGQAAVEAINVFHPATYYGFDVASIQDPDERDAWKTMIRTYGQTPRQLFRSAHPMVVQTLLSRVTSSSVPNALPYVKGLQWGSYVGSPADPPPRVVWRHQYRSAVATLVPLLTNDVFGLATLTSLLLCYGKSKSLSMLNTTCVLGAALITWGHSDGIVRVKLRKEQPPWPIIRSSNLDPIWICSSLPDCSQLWVGHASGKLVVYTYNFSPMKGQLDFRKPSVVLQGHSGGILALCICRNFSIVVSTSQDGTAIIWDMNNLTYVRSIPSAGSPVKLVSVSETLGDVAVVNDSVSDAPSSCIRLFSVNASLVGSVVVGGGVQITSICFSSAPEGISVNVLVAGLTNGIIRLWSTWDLSFIRDITCDILMEPIISVVYSHDSQHLYAASVDGCVVIWEAAGSKGVSKTPKFLNLTSL